MTFEKVANLDDVAVGSAINVDVGGEPVAVVRTATEHVKAVHNICSHQHYPLAPEGPVDDNTIECVLHGSTFDLDTGTAETLPAVAPIPVYACKVEHGVILVDIEQPLNHVQPARH